LYIQDAPICKILAFDIDVLFADDELVVFVAVVKINLFSTERVNNIEKSIPVMINITVNTINALAVFILSQLEDSVSKSFFDPLFSLALTLYILNDFI
jgi:hypothetical protein